MANVLVAILIISFCLMGFTLFFPVGETRPVFRRVIFYIALLLNFIPPFISMKILKMRNLDISLSSSMMERLGLITSIVFSEVVLAVVNGISDGRQLNRATLSVFSFGIVISFVLWWIFFDLIGNRVAKKGFANATYIELSFVPTLMVLGTIKAVSTILILLFPSWSCKKALVCEVLFFIRHFVDHEFPEF